MFPIFLAISMALTQLDQPVQGPLADVIEKRFDTFSERIEAWQKGSTLAVERLQEAQESRFAEMLQSLRDAAEERRSIIESIRSLNEQRDGLVQGLRDFRNDRDSILTRIAESRAEAKANREEMLKNIRESRAEMVGKFTPLQNIVDRLIALVWKLIYLIGVLLLLAVLVLAVGAWIYKKVLSISPI